MNLSPIVVDPAEAEAKVREYEALVAGERTAEDVAIAQAYRAAARGLPLISLKQVIGAGGMHEDGLPRLAIARAGTRECWVTARSGGTILYRDGESANNRGALVGRHTVRVPVALPWRSGLRWRGKAPVPLIPPNIRPRLRRLAGFHILWEVEAWEPVPSRDPALLRHICGDLWSVVAVWDLTDLEALVLSQTPGAV